jgi:ParB family transcriptional regulator, chromosome partitioning protein
MDLKHIRCMDIRSEESSDQVSRVEIEVLADSIREFGVLRPVLLRSTEGGYVIVHGKRRWCAAQMLGLEVIPAYLVENLNLAQEAHIAA